MNQHKTLVMALANHASPDVPEDVIGSALDLAIGEAQALADTTESLVAYALVGRLSAPRHFICDNLKLEWAKDAEPPSEAEHAEGALS